ncbi:MAG: glycosyltransferase [Deltaproteobacteria bacterium]|nr:glycosyltransferase [Deltaproteobacteria bacterium]
MPTFSFPFLPEENYDGKFVLAEARAYAANGAVVRVITPRFATVPHYENPEPGISVFRFDYFFPVRWQCLKRAGKPLYAELSWLSMLQIPFFLLVMAGKIFLHGRWADIIHAQWSLAALLSLPAKWMFGTKIVLTVRGSDIRLLPSWLNRFIHRQVDAAIDCFGPQPWNEEYKKRFPARYLTLPLIVYENEPVREMPADMAAILQNRNHPFIITYIGRFERLKIRDNNLPLLALIQAASVWKQKDLNFHLFYLGSGELRKEMEDLIKDLKLADRVTILGAKTNVMHYLQFSHLGVGGIAFNAVSQEITMAGKPQLLVDSSDNRDTPWVDGQNAIFIKPDDVMDLVTKVIWASRNPEQLQCLARQAKKDMASYFTGIKPGGKIYLQQFTSLLGAG